MIDINKYEEMGCTTATVNDYAIAVEELLAEVLRLRKYAELVSVIEVIYENNNSYELTWDEFNGMLKEMIE